MRRNAKLMAIAAPAFALAGEPGASAQVVTCTNCGSEATQDPELSAAWSAALEASGAARRIAVADAVDDHEHDAACERPAGPAATDLKALFALVAQAQSLVRSPPLNLDSRFQAKVRHQIQQHVLRQRADASELLRQIPAAGSGGRQRERAHSTLKGAGLQATAMQ